MKDRPESKVLDLINLIETQLVIKLPKDVVETMLEYSIAEFGNFKHKDTSIYIEEETGYLVYTSPLTNNVSLVIVTEGIEFLLDTNVNKEEEEGKNHLSSTKQAIVDYFKKVDFIVLEFDGETYHSLEPNDEFFGEEVLFDSDGLSIKMSEIDSIIHLEDNLFKIYGTKFRCYEQKSLDFKAPVVNLRDEEESIKANLEPVKDNDSLINTHNTDGSKTSFYDIFEGCTDVDSVCEKNNFLWHHGVILKSLVGIVLSSTKELTRHSGTDALRDARKIRASIDKIIIGLENDKKRKEG